MSCEMHAVVMTMDGDKEPEEEDIPKSALEISSFYVWPNYLTAKKGLMN